MAERLEEIESIKKLHPAVESYIINSLAKIEDLTAQEIGFLNKIISEIILSNKKLSVEKIEAQKKYGKVEKAKKYLDTLYHIAGYISPAFQSLVGFALLPENPVSGGFLIASSTATFITKFLQDTKLLNKAIDQFIKSEKDRDLVNKFMNGTLTCGSLTLSSLTILTDPSGAVIEIFEKSVNIKKVIDTAAQGAKTTNNILQNVVQYKVTTYERKITLIDMEKFKNNQKFIKVTNDTKNATDSQKRITNLVFQAFDINISK